MSQPTHTYGPTCHLTRTITLSSSNRQKDIPVLKAQFFYSSSLPLDDPLSVIPAPSSSDSVKHPLRPFSAYDSNALEEAWIDFTREKQQKSNDKDNKGKDTTSSGGNKSTSPREDSGHKASALSFGKDLPSDSNQSAGVGDTTSDGQYQNNDRPNSREAGTTGLPFLKYSTPSGSYRDEIESSSRVEIKNESESGDTGTLPANGCRFYGHTKRVVDVPVGISRLHLVKLPTLQMLPIYWSPINDVGAVIRGTWFYKDTMFPVPPAVANQLEGGYRALRPWSQTWKDELNSALEVGALGEEKISHRLWADGSKNASQTSAKDSSSGGPHCPPGCLHGQAAAEGIVNPDEGQKGPDSKVPVKLYLQSHVIYKDAQNAFILKPTLQPSAYYGRRPLQKIKRGMTVGIHVVRGFDWRAWEMCHPSKKSKVAAKVEQVAPVTGDADASKGAACNACQSQEERPRVTDLVLVIHGIGQKLSERVESFHFTHAINNFRRSVNVELANPAVQRVMRDDLGGLMVLPINWRSKLSFGDGGPMKATDKEQRASDFTLADLTPKSIPAIRNLISDVMLDIPFYMSHHKPRMIEALVVEANRVYRLWCKNNPEFEKYGRVHLLAHSLGSAMALEVLSKQPTSVPQVDPQGKKINSEFFDFDTTNLFFCGSPAGFFLLLERGYLIPRRSRGKPGAEPSEDADKSITGDAGTFGCLAVDNIYNIIQYNDPIAYRLNATVDPAYSATLREAHVPSTKTSFFSWLAAPGATPDIAVGQVVKPTIPRLPSQLEMDIHDFTREEMAEKKFCLLNDNCQVDWFLSTGGGPLEFQYLNMLGAHSSYWLSRDFIRMVVTECGRKPGRSNTLPNMRAIKIGHKP